MKVDSLGGEAGGLNTINQRAMDIKKEADNLLNKAKSGIRQLQSEYMKLLTVFSLCGLPIVHFGYSAHFSILTYNVVWWQFTSTLL